MKCGTDQHWVASVMEFDWPCNKRIAHGPHIIEDHVFLELDDYCTRQCPGVAAHPAVMIGRTVKP